MAKKKSFEVEIQSTSKDTPEQTSLELLINGEIVGTIEGIKKNTFEVVFNSKKMMKVQAVDEAVEFLIREYKLHGMS